MSLPKVGSARTDRRAVSFIDDLVFRSRSEGGLGFVYRDLTAVDRGVDGQIEIVNQDTDEITGKLIGVQVKGGKSYFRHPTADGWIVYIDKSTVEYWRNYSVPVVMTVVDLEQGVAFWTLASEGDFVETEKSYKIPVSSKQRLDASAAPTLERLSVTAPSEMAAKLRTLAAEVSESTKAALDRHRAVWRQGTRSDARGWVQALSSSPARLAALAPEVAAQVLRFAAGIILEEDHDTWRARVLADDARRCDPSWDDGRLQAALSLSEGNEVEAFAILADSPSVSSQTLLASVQSRQGDLDAASETLARIEPEAALDHAEVWRVTAELRLASGDLDGAQAAITEAEAHDPLSVRTLLFRAMLRYLSGLVCEGVPTITPSWPPPIQDEYRRRDPTSLTSFQDSADDFAQLLRADWTEAERRHIEAWRLAALLALPDQRRAAEAFIATVFARDPAQPFVLLWAVTHGLLADPRPRLESLHDALMISGDVQTGALYVASSLEAGEVEGLAGWLDSWRDRFEASDNLPEWAFWRARVAIAEGETEIARDLVDQVDADRASTLRVELLAAEAKRTGDSKALIEYVETVGVEQGRPYLLLNACYQHAEEGRWESVAPHIDLLLAHFPTPPVKRLAIFSHYQNRNLEECRVLLDEALAHPEPGTDEVELRRMRGDVLMRTGDPPGAIRDFDTLIARSTSPATGDLLALARARFFAGQDHELAACSRLLRQRNDLGSSDALMLSEMLSHGAPDLSREFWHQADDSGISDDLLTTAVVLGYRLGLDEHLGNLQARMVAQAHTGTGDIQQLSVSDFLQWNRDWEEERDRVLELYRQGETATHFVAKFLNLPLVHFYHVLPASNEAQLVLRHSFPLQFRSGSRATPEHSGEVAAPGRLALDLSALLLAAHLGILDHLENAFSPIHIPHLAIVALRDQRDRLRHHQPSRMEVSRRLLAAERRGKLHQWSGDPAPLAPDEREQAGNWHRWVALLERARREGAFVLDLPVGDETDHGRPTTVAGEERLSRLICVNQVRRRLVASGVIEATSAGEAEPGSEIGPGEAHTAASPDIDLPAALARGATVYLTDGGAEALADADLLDAAANFFVLFVDEADQDLRRAQVEGLYEIEDNVQWLDALIRRVSDGLTDNKYAVIPGQPRRSGSPSVPTGDATPEKNIGDGEGTGAVSSDEAATRDDPTSMSLAFECLVSLTRLPPGEFDAVWIEDRWINRHRFAGTSRVVDVLEILAALEEGGQIATAERWRTIQRLRSANVRIIPFSAPEIVHHLQSAPIAGRSLVETPGLRVLRQYAAALLEDAHALQVPTAEELAQGILGDLDVVRSYAAAMREALVEIWKHRSNQADASSLARAEAESLWLLHHMYLDVGLLRLRARMPNAGNETAVSAFATASLFVSAISLLSSEDVFQPTDGDAIARAYTRCVYDEVVAARIARDEPFRVALVTHLRDILRDWSQEQAESTEARVVSQVMAGRVFDALPNPLKDLVGKDSDFLTSLGRRVISALTIGRWEVATSDFSDAASALLEGWANDEGRAPDPIPIPLLESEPEVELLLGTDGDNAFTLTSPEGNETVRLQDVAFGILSHDEQTRRAACAAVQPETDVGTREWADITEHIISLDEPAARLEALTQYRVRAIDRRYSEMISRWRAAPRISHEDLRPPPVRDVCRHLRINHAAGVPSATSGAGGDSINPPVWERAASTLLAEDGFDVALQRLMSLPVPMPRVLLQSIDEMPSDDQESLVRRLAREPTSPIADVHFLKILCHLGHEEPRYLRLARHRIRRLASMPLQEAATVLSLVAEEAHRDLSRRAQERREIDSGTQSGRDHQLAESAAMRLVASWHHAHRFVGALRAVGGDPAGLAQWFKERASQSIDRLFDLEGRDEGDLALPRLLRPTRFIVGALQYATAGTPLLDDQGSVLALLQSELTVSSGEARLPHFDLLRDLTRRTDRLGTWLQPEREPNGTIKLGSLTVVDEGNTPVALCSQALDDLASDPANEVSWFSLEIVRGKDPLTDSEARRFEQATDDLDIPGLLEELEGVAALAAHRLARQALVANDSERRERLRDSFRAVEEVRDTEDPSSAPSSTSRHAGELSEVQRAVVEGLYLLAQVGPTPADATARFGEDLRALSRMSPAYLGQLRGVLERLVVERPISEAQAFLGLLVQARGV